MQQGKLEKNEPDPPSSPPTDIDNKPSKAECGGECLVHRPPPPASASSDVQLLT